MQRGSKEQESKGTPSKLLLSVHMYKNICSLSIHQDVAQSPHTSLKLPENKIDFPPCPSCNSAEKLTFVNLRESRARHTRSKARSEGRQLTVWESQQKPETEYPLKIEPLPPALQWCGQERFWLIHIESGLRVPGSWTVDEAELILDLSRKWDWSIDKQRRVVCGLQLLALAEAVCKRSSSRIGGEG